MSRAEHRSKLLEFLATVCPPQVSFAMLADETPFEDSGVVDSLVVLEIVSFLEREFALDFAATGIRAEDVGSVARILDLIERRAPR